MSAEPIDEHLAAAEAEQAAEEADEQHEEDVSEASTSILDHIMGKGRKPADEPLTGDFPLADSGKYSVGVWSGLPLYQCPFCGYNYATRRGDGTSRIEDHILARVNQGNLKHLQALEEISGEGGKA